MSGRGKGGKGLGATILGKVTRKRVRDGVFSHLDSDGHIPETKKHKIIFGVPFDVWPELILNNIANFLNIESIVACRLTCKKFNDSIMYVPPPIVESVKMITEAIEHEYANADKPNTELVSIINDNGRRRLIRNEIGSPITVFLHDLKQCLTSYLRTMQLPTNVNYHFNAFYEKEGVSNRAWFSIIQLTPDTKIGVRYLKGYNCRESVNEKLFDMFVFTESDELELQKRVWLNLASRWDYRDEVDPAAFSRDAVEKIISHLELDTTVDEFITELLTQLKIPAETITHVLECEDAGAEPGEFRNYSGFDKTERSIIDRRVDTLFGQIKTKFNGNVNIVNTLLKVVNAYQCKYILEQNLKQRADIPEHELIRKYVTFVSGEEVRLGAGEYSNEAVIRGACSLQLPDNKKVKIQMFHSKVFQYAVTCDIPQWIAENQNVVQLSVVIVSNLG
jgi:hypothetical protein